MDDRRLARYSLVTAGHRFLLAVLPVRVPDSQDALVAFVAAIRSTPLPAADIDSVLLRCLTVLTEHTGWRLPSLVDQYLAASMTAPPGAPWVPFLAIVEDFLAYWGVSDGTVQQAIQIVRDHYPDPLITSRSIARTLGLRQDHLCSIFRRSTHRTLQDYIRDVRMDHASHSLATTSDTIKEVWAQCGYNHASNFCHDFKARFGCTPGVFRSRVVRPIALELLNRPAAQMLPTNGAHDPTQVLIIDPDEYSRVAVGGYLTSLGYVVVGASKSTEGLQHAVDISPRVILFEYHLDDMDGSEFLDALRRSPLQRQPAVGILTADWDLHDDVDRLALFDVPIESKLCHPQRIAGFVSSLSLSRPADIGR